MRIDDQRRSNNFEDRGRGSSRGGGSVPIQLVVALFRVLGFKGTLILAGVLGGGYVLAPASILWARWTHRDDVRLDQRTGGLQAHGALDALSARPVHARLVSGW